MGVNSVRTVVRKRSPDRDLKAGLLLEHAAGTGVTRTRLCH
jgi:hypothetical protein